MSSVSTSAPRASRCYPCSWLGYNGQLHEPGVGWQFLGNGYRIYNPMLMRFHSPDHVSPFGRGGMNCYAYCEGDPVNRVDPSGQYLLPLATLMGLGAATMGGLAISKGVEGDKESAALFGVIAGGLLVGAGMVAGMRRIFARQSPPLKLGEVRFRAGRNQNVVDVHGWENSSRVGAENLDGTRLAALVNKKGMGNRPIHLVSCRSADGPVSQGQVLADATGQKVTAYRGPVFVSSFTGKPTGKYHRVVFRPQPEPQRSITAIRNTDLHRQVWQPRHNAHTRRAAPPDDPRPPRGLR